MGDIWTWTALCADTKLIAGWYVGERSAEAGRTFMTDLASRLTNRVQLTTGGFRGYSNSVVEGFHGDIAYAVLIKLSGQPEGGSQERKYSPQVVTKTIIGSQRQP